ncbi:MAG TPA: glycosyltransferase, partial [Caulobacteraceae bacterium]|nr:glycosyltransferase [Caulobacteraceae bacterium]
PTLDGLHVDVAVGEEAPSLPRLRALAAAHPQVALHVDADDMAALMTDADIAIGAGGSSAWERCCLGLPSLVVILAENQRENTQALVEQGASLAIDAATGDLSAGLLSGLARLRKDAVLRRGLSDASAALCDGDGARRVAERLIGLI